MKITDMVGVLFMLVGMTLIIIGLKSTFVSMDVLAQSENGSQSSQIMINLMIGGLLLIVSILLMVNKRR